MRRQLTPGDDSTRDAPVILKLFILFTILAVIAICVISIAVSTNKGTEILQDTWDKAVGGKDEPAE